MSIANKFPWLKYKNDPKQGAPDHLKVKLESENAVEMGIDHVLGITRLL